eukprot:403331820
MTLNYQYQKSVSPLQATLTPNVIGSISRQSPSPSQNILNPINNQATHRLSPLNHNSFSNQQSKVFLNNSMNNISSNGGAVQQANLLNQKNVNFSSNNDYFGKIGWGTNSPTLNISPQRVVLEDMPHKQFFDRERANVFTKMNGEFSKNVDKRLGISLEAFQNLDIRSLRILIKQKVWQQSNQMKNVFLNKNHSHSRSQTSGRLTFDESRRIPQQVGSHFNSIKTGSIFSGSALKTPNVQEHHHHEFNSDLLQTPLINHSSANKHDHGSKFKAARNSIIVGQTDHETDSILLSSPLGHLGPGPQSNTHINSKYRLNSMDNSVLNHHSHNHSKGKTQKLSTTFNNNYQINEDISEINQSKNKCPKLMKMINSQIQRIEDVKIKSLKKKQFYNNQYRNGSMDRSNHLQIEEDYGGNQSQNNNYFLGYSKLPHEKQALNPLPYINNKTQNIKFKNKSFQGGDPYLNFQLQQKNQQNIQMYKIVGLPGKNNNFHETGSFPKMLGLSTNENSQATNISQSFVNNSTQKDALMEFSRMSSKPTQHFTSLQENSNEVNNNNNNLQ